jgi:hypothetical protein
MQILLIKYILMDVPILRVLPTPPYKYGRTVAMIKENSGYFARYISNGKLTGSEIENVLNYFTYLVARTPISLDDACVMGYPIVCCVCPFRACVHIAPHIEAARAQQRDALRVYMYDQIIDIIFEYSGFSQN